MTTIEYWKARCEAAEKCILVYIGDHTQNVSSYEIIQNWKKLASTPEPELELPDTENNLRE